MPYISTERVREIRQQIKKEFPKPWKFSIRREHHSSVYVEILEGPIEMVTSDDYNGRRYEQVNHFYIKDHYKDHPEVMKVLLRIYEIMNEGNGTFVVDSDYGVVPDFYTHIAIGRWNEDYKVK